MLGTAQRLSTRIVSNRRLVARTALFALLAALLIAAPAQAAEAIVDQGPETVAEGSPGPQPQDGEGSPETGGQATPEGAVGEASEPAPPPEAAAESPPPAPAEVTPEAVEPPPPPAPEAQPESPQPEEPELPTSESSTTPEAPSHAKGDEKNSMLLPALGAAPPSAGDPPGGEADSTGTITGTPTGSMVINLAEAHVASETSGDGPRVAVAKAGASGEGGAPCDLQGLGGPRASGCAGGWLTVTGALTPGDVSLASVGVALATAPVGSGGDQNDQGGTAGGGHPMPPSPGPSPGGASGAGVGAGGAGAGLSGFLAFALLLALAAPRAMRRLRLACLPWRAAFFALIPERPG